MLCMPTSVITGIRQAGSFLLTLLELSQVGLQDRGVEGQAARVQLAHKDALCL